MALDTSTQLKNCLLGNFLFLTAWSFSIISHVFITIIFIWIVDLSGDCCIVWWTKKDRFDACYDGNSTQEEIFEKEISPMLNSLFAGYNTTVFAYGMTGAGKTHTMQGTVKEPGTKLLQNLPHCFNQLKESFRGQRTSCSKLYSRGRPRNVKPCKLHTSPPTPWVNLFFPIWSLLFYHIVAACSASV